VTYRERAARLQRIQEGLIRVAAWMLEPTEENMASATIVTASVLQDIVAVGGARTATRAFEQLTQLVNEGVLQP
jgi:hypothetical protein